MHVRVAIFQNIKRFIRQPEAAGRSCRLPNGNGACALGNWSSPDRRSLGRTPRRGRTWLAHAVVGTPQAVAGHGQLRALSHSLRERISTRGHPPNRLFRQPARRDREHSRRRPGGVPCARAHRRQSTMDGNRIGPSAGRHPPGWLAKEPQRTRWPAVPGTDLPSRIRYSGYHQPRRELEAG
jgi:hypothetical protein